MSKKKTGKKATSKKTSTKVATIQTAGAEMKNTMLPEIEEDRVEPGHGKNQDKNIRASIGEEEDVNKISQDERVRMAIGRQARMDVSFYERLPEYKDMTLFWENNINGAVERWLQLGAELVPRKTQSLKKFKGFTDQVSGEWECRAVGTDDAGKTMMAYLLFLPKEEYHELRIAPREKRNKDMEKSLKIGASQTKQVDANTTGIKTYAPNNPIGEEKGFEQAHEVVHDA